MSNSNYIFIFHSNFPILLIIGPKFCNPLPPQPHTPLITLGRFLAPFSFSFLKFFLALFYSSTEFLSWCRHASVCLWSINSARFLRNILGPTPTFVGSYLSTLSPDHFFLFSKFSVLKFLWSLSPTACLVQCSWNVCVNLSICLSVYLSVNKISQKGFYKST